jgi:hypothetical protein
MENLFNEKDIDFIASKGYELEKIKQQLAFFHKGVAPLHLVKSATVGDGIQLLTLDEKLFFSHYFDTEKSKHRLEKFVPASGAATRMFQFLNAFLNNFDPNEETLTSYINKTGDQNLNIFIVGIQKFPFHAQLKEKTRQLFPDYDSFSRDQKVHAIVFTLLHKSGLDFASKPKGVLPFHKKNNLLVTPVEEHIEEVLRLNDRSGKDRIHFTISKEFQSNFDVLVSKHPEVAVHFSYQNETTDTLAVDEHNKPFRLADGSLLFRPAGHGALIENLNQVDADLIFIKNIDNVSQVEQDQCVFHQKVLAGIVLHLQNKIFDYIHKLQDENNDEAVFREIMVFVEQQLSIQLPEAFQMFKRTYQKSYLLQILDRPIRVCGMVKNEGEPGGGPFWVQDNKGRITLQIVEMAQLDVSNELQKNCVNSATHFNPVDIVCGVKNAHGQKFDLTKFSDHDAVIITQKTYLGKPIKAIELPGLWNGAMAKWTTIFVEVPLTTFNPVKSVNDLLKPAHQPVFEP